MVNKKNIIIFSVILLVIFLDQSSKFFVKNNFKLTQSVPIIKDVLHFTYINNTGSAFGLFKNFNIIFILFSVIVILIILYNLKKINEKEKAMQLSVGLLLGGTIGNLIDRLYNDSVIDFIDLRFWPVFNIADSAVTISIAILIFILWNKENIF